MTRQEAIFSKKKVIFEKLLATGFIFSKGIYSYQEIILDGDFEVRVRIDQTGHVFSQVYDLDLEEEYTAIHISRATGAFIGQVREAYLAVLERLAETCFVALPFAKDQTNRLAKKIAEEWSDPMDYPFEKHSEYASYRIGGKWYALIFPLKLAKLGVTGNKAELSVEVVNLKVDPDDMEGLLAQPGVYPSYHMSKKNWISVVLDDSLSDDALWELVARSRQLANPTPLRNSSGPDFWVIPANPKVFNIDAEFAENKIVYWNQKGKIKKGDLVAMYVTAPVQAIRYICRCLEAQIDNSSYPGDSAGKKRMKVELIHTFDDSLFPFAVMKEFGVRAVRGPRRLTKEMIEAIEKKMAGK